MSKVLIAFKELNSSRKLGAAFKISISIFIGALVIFSVISASYSENLNKGLAESLVRLHVIANSDSPEDQELKRDVRDVIISFMKAELKASTNIEQTKKIISANLGKIEKLAQAEIQRQGKAYTVKSELGNFPFPTKAYGDITLPAGYYQALRVVIGKGEGANWWCVLFPPLCFVDATHGTVPESAKKGLKDTLSSEEYNLITSADSDEDIPVKIKFKVFEFFEQSKIKFTGLISSIFKK